MSLKERIENAWQVHKAETANRQREEFLRLLRQFTGSEEITLIDADGSFVAEVEGIRFAPLLGNRVVVIKDTVLGIMLVKKCEKCKQDIKTAALDSLGEVGKYLENFDSKSYHFCSEDLFDTVL